MIDYCIEPDFLRSDTVLNALARVRNREFHTIEKADEIWRDDRITDKLYESHHGKCCYCERKRDRKRDMDVEHFRPKGKIENVEDHEGYWWLIYSWDNLLWSCKTCNQKYKGTKFTLLRDGRRSYTEADDLNLEMPALINPNLEDPSQYLSFHIDRYGQKYFVKAVPRADINEDDELKALETIRIAGLNRNEPGYDLVQERGEELSGTEFEQIVIDILHCDGAKNKVPENRQFYLDTINECREKLKKFIQSKRDFSGVYRDYLRRKNIEYESMLHE